MCSSTCVGADIGHKLHPVSCTSRGPASSLVQSHVAGTSHWLSQAGLQIPGLTPRASAICRLPPGHCAALVWACAGHCSPAEPGSAPQSLCQQLPALWALGLIDVGMCWALQPHKPWLCPPGLQMGRICLLGTMSHASRHMPVDVDSQSPGLTS